MRDFHEVCKLADLAVGDLCNAFDKVFIDGKHQWILSDSTHEETRCAVFVVEAEASPTREQYEKMKQSKRARMLAQRVVQAGRLMSACANKLISNAACLCDIDLKHLQLDGKALYLDVDAYQAAVRASQLPPHVAAAGRHGRSDDDDVVIIGGLCGVVQRAVKDAVSEFINNLDVLLLSQSQLLMRIVAYSSQVLGDYEEVEDAKHHDLVMWLVDAVTDYVTLSADVEDPRRTLREEVECRRSSDLTVEGVEHHVRICRRDLQQLRAFATWLEHTMQSTDAEDTLEAETFKSGRKRVAWPCEAATGENPKAWWVSAQDMLASKMVVPELRELLSQDLSVFGAYNKIVSLAEQYVSTPPQLQTLRLFLSEAHMRQLLKLARLAAAHVEERVLDVDSKLSLARKSEVVDLSMFTTYLPVLEVDGLGNAPAVQGDDFVAKVRSFARSVQEPAPSGGVMTSNSTEVPDPTWRVPRREGCPKPRVRNSWVTSRPSFYLPRAEHRVALLSAVEFLLGCGYIEPGVFDARFVASRYNNRVELLTRFNELLAESLWVMDEMSNHNGVGLAHYRTTRTMCDPGADDAVLVQTASRMMRNMSARELRDISGIPRYGTGAMDPLSGKQMLPYVRKKDKPAQVRFLHSRLHDTFSAQLARRGYGIVLPESFTWFALDALACAIESKRLSLSSIDRRDQFLLAPRVDPDEEGRVEELSVAAEVDERGQSDALLEVAQALRSVSILDCLFDPLASLDAVRALLSVDGHDCIEHSLADWRRMAGSTREAKLRWDALDAFVVAGTREGRWGPDNGTNVAFVRNASTQRPSRRRIRLHLEWIRQYGAIHRL